MSVVRPPEDRGAGFAEVRELIAGVSGWLTEGQARRLWEAAREVPAGGRIVEIGSFHGRSTIVLARGSQPDIELVAIDPHAGSDRGPQEITPDHDLGDQDLAAFRANIHRTGVAQRVHHVREFSSAAHDLVSGQIDLLYVDGAHRYRPAREDIERWGARVKPGGVMLVHDAFNAVGVTLVQLRLLVPSASWSYRGRCGSLAEYRRLPLTGLARMASVARQLAGLPYFARNMIIKVLIVARLRPLTRLLGHSQAGWPY